MGSSNYTCIVSGLPIQDGEPVRFLVLVENEWNIPNDYICYVTGRWQVRSVPLRALYNDCGSISQIKFGLASRVLRESLKAELVKQSWFNRRMSWEDWLHALGGGYVCVRGRNRSRCCGECSHRMVAQAMIKEEVWKHLLKPFDVYDGTASVDPYKQAVPEVIEALRGFPAWYQSEGGRMSHKYAVERYFFECCLFSREDYLAREGGPQNPFLWALLHTREGESGFGFIDAFLLAQKLAKSEAQLLEFGTDLAELIHVQNHYACLRGQWQPVTGGPQDAYWRVHRRFHEELAILAKQGEGKEREGGDDEC